MLTDEQARALGECVGAGGVAVFPADTVYGLACDPENAAAVARLYALKGRPQDKPAAVMFFDLAALDETVRGETAGSGGAAGGDPLDAVLRGGLLPGGVTLLLANPAHRFPLACADDPDTLGVRVPFLAPVGRPILQTSANRSGGADARRLQDVPASIRSAADLVLDGGELPGVPSTVIDLRAAPRWRVVREGAVGVDRVASVLGQISDVP